MTTTATRVMSEDDVGRAVRRIAHEIVEREPDGVVLLGIREGGVWMADALAEALFSIDGHRPPCGALDITFHRDDIGLRPVKPGVSDVPVDITGSTVVLVDDVLYTGRTVRAALDAVQRYGRPNAVRLAVLVDRGHRELPIRPDFVGKNLPTSKSESVLATAQGVVIEK